MNKVILVGRLTRDPEVRYSQGAKETVVARYTLAVNRRFTRDNEAAADFIPCVVFGGPAEFAEKYFCKGLRIAVSGRIQTGSYINKERCIRDRARTYDIRIVMPSAYRSWIRIKIIIHNCLLYYIICYMSLNNWLDIVDSLLVFKFKISCNYVPKSGT